MRTKHIFREPLHGDLRRAFEEFLSGRSCPPQAYAMLDPKRRMWPFESMNRAIGEIEPGAVTVIEGARRSGKSTLLRELAIASATSSESKIVLLTALRHSAVERINLASTILNVPLNLAFGMGEIPTTEYSPGCSQISLVGSIDVRDVGVLEESPTEIIRALEANFDGAPDLVLIDDVDCLPIALDEVMSELNRLARKTMTSVVVTVLTAGQTTKEQNNRQENWRRYSETFVSTERISIAESERVRIRAVESRILPPNHYLLEVKLDPEPIPTSYAGLIPLNEGVDRFVRTRNWLRRNRDVRKERRPEDSYFEFMEYSPEENPILGNIENIEGTETQRDLEEDFNDHVERWLQDD